MANKKSKHDYLTRARKEKNDEFYTQYSHIEEEIISYLDYDKDVFKDKTILLPCDDPEWSNFTKFFAQNFERFGIKKLISTSYAPNSKIDIPYQPTLFETESPYFNKDKSVNNGKIFTLTKDITGDGKIDIDDLEWQYLDGSGDFNSEEIKKLRDEADIIITNPPFSLFRDFVNWIFEAKKKFIIIGNMDAITYIDIFPLIRDEKMWLGAGLNDGRNVWYRIPDNYDEYQKMENGKKYAFVPKTIWFTNIDHGRRHEPLQLMTEADIIKFSTKKPFEKYDNYDAIEVSRKQDIPSDYKGVMGVPVSFMSVHCPDQFKILGSNRGVNQDPNKIYGRSAFLNGKEVFKRIFIQHKNIKE